jgi:hypothetical protein
MIQQLGQKAPGIPQAMESGTAPPVVWSSRE